ncbi:hypothetical protein JZ751_015671 [Albula glossodonta]|uniref:Cilia- and flagella-associated protein 418 n=1 Tax=Albula glossodonta TaxID=121402 RepID=A0A8T2NRE9_9TELE|nr:hypothetical protein JZ751_015671 [Albula glossodonta]
MADDLDELLDEVESKFCRNVSVTSASLSSCQEDGNYLSPTIRKAEGKSGTHGSPNPEPCKNLDAEDIDALLEDILDDDDDDDSFNIDMLSYFSWGKFNTKWCWNEYFTKVSVNTMPDRQKLQAKLRRKRSARAYTCQCTWRSVVHLTDLRDHPQLKWVCGKHNT